MGKIARIGIEKTSIEKNYLFKSNYHDTRITP